MKLCKGISSCYCAADFMVHSTLFDGDERNQAADLLNAIVPEGETQRYKVRRNSTYQTKSELL